MTLYRIHTEDKHYNQTVDTVAEFFQGATIYREVTGLWRGVREESIAIELLLQEDQLSLVRALARAIKQVNQQVSVYLTSQPITLECL